MATLRLGDTAPDFTADSSIGTINLYDYLGDSWGILFSHPADFTPVCTTELGTASNFKGEFDNESIEAILHTISLSTPFKYTINQNTITIESKS